MPQLLKETSGYGTRAPPVMERNDFTSIYKKGQVVNILPPLIQTDLYTNGFDWEDLKQKQNKRLTDKRRQENSKSDRKQSNAVKTRRNETY